MEYSPFTEVDLSKFEGKAFACIAIKKEFEKQRILLISSTQLLESTPVVDKTGFAYIQDCHQLEGLVSIKFSREKYGTIFIKFKSGSALEYKVKDAGLCADYIKKTMTALGMKGNITKSKPMQAYVKTAEELLKITNELELKFAIDPSIALIQELMETLREAVERFENASDDRFMIAIQRIQKFLARSDVLDVLDQAARPNDHKINEALTVNDVKDPVDSISKISPSISMPTSENGAFETVSALSQGINTETLPISSNHENFDPEDDIYDNQPYNVTNEENGSLVDELQAMLGNITQEFDEILTSFEDRPTKVSIPENVVVSSYDGVIEDIFNI